MKIITKTGNLLKVTAGHIVHGCNAQGVMGSGVALGVKETHPLAFEEYVAWHARGDCLVGSVLPVAVTDTLIIWNAVTQNLYGKGQRLTSYDAVTTCFEAINEFVAYSVVEGVPAEVHIPLIGAARGGGNWEIIREIIEQTMTVPVTLWLPDSTVTTL